MVWRGLPIEGGYAVTGSIVTLSPRAVLRRPISDLGEGMAQFGAKQRLEAKGKVLVGEFQGTKVVLKQTSAH